MNHHLLLSVTAAALAAAAQQQPVIEGTVLDPSGRPVRGARVECSSRTAATSLDGSFTVPGVDRCRATVTAPGFAVAEIDLAAGTAGRIELAVAGVSERVVVTATRNPALVEEAGVSATVVTGADLARREFPMIYDVLREVPGLYVSQSGRYGGLTSVYTRGAQRTGTLVMIDGMPVTDPGGEYNLAHLTSTSFERIEVVRGPESALFGAEASAGAIQLFTRQGDPEARVPHGSLSYERGSFQSDRWIANLSGGSGARLDYSLVAEQFHTVGEFQNDYYRNTTGSANVGFRIAPSTEIRGVFRTSDAIGGVPGQTAFGLYDLDANETNRDTSLSLRLDDARGSRYLQRFFFGYHRLHDLYGDFAMDGPYNLAALVRDVSGPPARTYLVRLLDAGGIPSQPPDGTRLVQQEVLLWPLFEPFLSQASRKRLGYQGTLDHKGGSLVFGYDYERQEGDISKNDVLRNNHGLFLHEQRAVGSRLFLAGGVRVENSSAFGTKFAPRGAASFLLAGERGPLSSTYLRFSAGRGITEPSLLQNFARESFFVGNPDLRPEKTTSLDAGLVQEWFGRRLRTEVTAFQNSFQDLIVFVSLPPPVWGSWDNVDRSRARGLEFSGKARLGKYVIVSGAWTRMWTRVIHSNAPGSPFSGIGQELGRRPGNSGSVALAIAPRRWSFQAGAVLVGERQDSDFWLGVNRSPAYQNVYASGSFRLTKNVVPFLRAENLLNGRYQEVLGYSSLSRAVRGGLRVEW
jgi:outer membrane cobalamin receptor